MARAPTALQLLGGRWAVLSGWLLMLMLLLVKEGDVFGEV